MVVISIGAVMLPKLVSITDENEKNTLLKYSLDSIIFLSVPISILLYLLADDLVLLISGNEFMPSANVLRIVSFSVILIGLSNFFGIQMLTSMEKDKYLLFSVTLGLIVSVVFNLALSPKFSYIGTSISSISAEITVTLATFYYCKKIFSLKFPSRSMIIAILSCLLFPIVYYITNNFQLEVWIKILIIGFCCSLLYFLIQYFLFKNYILKLYLNKISSYYRLKR